MARIEGTGIKEPSKEAKLANLNFLRNPKKFLQDKIDKKLDSYTKEGKTPFGTSIGGSAVGEEGLGRFGNQNELSDASTRFGNQFSPSVEVASANLTSLNVGDSFTKQTEKNLADTKVASAGDSFDESDYKGYLKAIGIKSPRTLSPTFNRLLRENYQMDKKEGIYKDGQIFNRSDTLLNKAPKEEKPSFIAQTKNLAGSIFDAVTGTQRAEASQIPGGMPTSGTQFSPSGDTSFASYRMAGQPPTTTTPQTLSSKQESKTYEQNRLKTGEKFADRGQREAVNASGSQQANVRGSAFNTGKDESKRPKTVTVDGQTVAARQTVASLPSDYKQTEAREFAKTEAYQRAKKNPNVKVGVDSKGQPRATAVQKTRSEAGPSARTAQGNQARVKQNAQARAQAAAVNRKLSGKSISQTKAANRASMRASAAARNASFQARKKAGTLSRSERTASGQRAAKKAAARKRAQAAAKRRRKKSKK